MLTQKSLPWWRTDLYEGDEPLPDNMVAYAGPNGIALVSAFEDGRTQEGWGLLGKKDPVNGGFKPGFMHRYLKNQFKPRKALSLYEKGVSNFAIVMRSVNLVCIDIDGKNGGLEHAKALGALPHTMAETSKSGTGYHLFYSVDDEWSDEEGFGFFKDRISIVTGVDVRATGCVYHYPQQRWNGRDVAPLPKHLADLLIAREQKNIESTQRIKKVLSTEDETEIIMLHDELISDLKKPIQDGKRNNTLFAIGSKMMQAEVPDWETLIEERALAVGLSVNEANKLTTNITAYGDNN